MIYLYALLLMIVYLINAQFGLSAVLVLGISTILYILSYLHLKSKYNRILCCVILMIISLPFSWNPMWGGRIGSSQVTWFYLWMTITIFVIATKQNACVGKLQRYITIVCIILLLYSFLPLLISKSILAGMKEFIMIDYLIIITIFLILKGIGCSEAEKKLLINLYVYESYLIGLGMVIQYIGFKVFGVTLFGFKTLYSWGGEIQTGCHLLMDDASSGTIALGVGAMLALIHRKEDKKLFFELFIIVIGMACSGRRTGILSLLVAMGFYFVIGIKNIKGKLISVFSFGFVSLIALRFMSFSRAISNSSQMLDDNGRFQLWSEGLSLLRKQFWLGYGYDNEYLADLMPSKMIVHNTVIRWLDMGGIFYGGLLIIFFGLIMIALKKYKQLDYFWALIYSCIGSMFIPDFLNARFMYILIALSIMSINDRYRDRIRGIGSHER